MLLVQMDLRCGNIVPLQNGPNGVPLFSDKGNQPFPFRLHVQIGTECIKDRLGVMLGKVYVLHGLHCRRRVVFRQILGSQHHAAPVDLLLQILFQKRAGIGIQVLGVDPDQIACLIL